MTKRLVLPSKWYCKYCYKVQPIEVGQDGSIIICSVCGCGLAPWTGKPLRDHFDRITTGFNRMMTKQG